MRVVDTSAWIEWLADRPLSADLAHEIPDRDQCLVPTIVQLELSKWLMRERSDEEADEMIAYTQKCLVVPLGRRRRIRRGERGDGAQHLAAVPDRDDAKVFEILLVQRAQDVEVDMVFREARGVFREVKRRQPVCRVFIRLRPVG